MADGSTLEELNPQQADTLLDAAALDHCENAVSSMGAETDVPSRRADSSTIDHGNSDETARAGNCDAVAAYSEVEAQPPRERPNRQRRRQRRDSADIQSASHAEIAPTQDVQSAAAKHMAGVALHRLSVGGGEPATTSRDHHLHVTTATTGNSSPGEDHQRTRYSRHRLRATHSGKRHSSPGGNTTRTGSPGAATAAGLEDPVLDPVASEDLVAAASAAALAAALGSVRLASIAAARPPPPPEEVKVRPPRPNFMRSVTAPRTDGGGYYSLTVSYDSPPTASASTSGYVIRSPSTSPVAAVPIPRNALTSPPPAAAATTAPRMARSTSMSPLTR
ncbi:hypothetical protein Vretifemale_18003, partial [Volvox reticuliferus]